jgi:arabinose-5-phosphate isomerase
MNLNNKNIKENPFVIEKDFTLKQAMETISANQKGTAAVINEEGKLVGILSDGDTRRALLRESSLITPVEKIMNVNYIFYQQEAEESPEEIFQKYKKITILPIIDRDHKLIDVLTIK